MNMMRSIVKAADLPKYLWAEAIYAAFYIKNRFTSSKKSTPLNSGLIRNQTSLTSRFTDARPTYMFPSKTGSRWMIEPKSAS